jgi:hypothetical protein
MTGFPANVQQLFGFSGFETRIAPHGRGNYTTWSGELMAEG